MKVTMLLCDHAEVADNKLFINGAGWDMCGSPSPPHAVAVLVHVPWDQTNTVHRYTLQLLDEDGQSVTMPGPTGQVAVEAAGSFEVGRPPGVPHGTPIAVPIALNVGPLLLDLGRGYEWRLVLEGAAGAHWTVAFRTVSARA